MHYNFFFDETFHDRKITIKPTGVINTFTENKNDSYIGVFWGYENTRRAGIVRKLHALEAKYKKRYGLSEEFKSTNIGKKNFNYGIHSLNPDARDFYRDFFTLLETISPIIHVNVVSKIEIVVRAIFTKSMLAQTPSVIPDRFYYSLSKFILTYHSQSLIESMYHAAEVGDGRVFQMELLNHLEKVIISIDGIARKIIERSALRQLHMIVSNFRFENPVNQKYDFVYDQNFHGLMNLLTERRISPKKVNIVVDQEENTYHAAASFPFKSIRQVDSTNSVNVRVADHLCGFIGRMMHALMEDKTIKEDPVTDINRLSENDLERKHLLSPEWFDLKPEQFLLYKQVYTVLVSQQTAYWATMTWSYGDQVSMFYTLLHYIASYKSFADYCTYSPEDHAEFYNSACCDALELHYSKL